MTLLVPFLTGWAHWIVEATWQLALFATIVLAIALVARHRLSSQTLYLLWMLVAVKALLPPALAVPWGVGAWALRPALEQMAPRARDQASQQTAAELSVAEVKTVGTEAVLSSPPRRQPAPALEHRSGTIDQSDPLGEASTAGETLPFSAVIPAAPIAHVPFPDPPSTTSETPRNVNALPFTLATLFIAWVLGVMAIWTLMASRAIRLRSLARSASPLTDPALLCAFQRIARQVGVRRTPDISLTDRVGGAYLCHLLRPRVILSKRLTRDLTPSRLACLLAHELTHLKRRDLWAEWLQAIALSLFWFHPLLWLANARARQERESACDQAALRYIDASPFVFGETIAQVAAVVGGHSLLAPGFLGRRSESSNTYQRIEKIMNATRQSARSSVLAFLFVSVFAALFLPMGLSAVDPAASPTDPPSPATEATAPEATPIPSPTPPPHPTDAPTSAFGEGYVYAWQSGDGEGHRPPDYEGFFPDDPEASKRLAEIADFNASKWMDDHEVCRIVRNGLKRYPDKDRIMSWFGNKYIWGNNPQNPDAIEIAYHMYGSPGLQYNALYFGLSTVSPPMPAAICRAFVDSYMTNQQGDAGRIKWGARGHIEPFVRRIAFYQQSEDPEVVARAERLLRVFDEQLARTDPLPTPEATTQYREQYQERQKAFRAMVQTGDDDALRKAIRENQIDWDRSISAEENTAFLKRLQTFVHDQDAKVRENLAGYVGNHFIWSTGGDQHPLAIEMMLEMSFDAHHSVRYKVIYFGLSTIQNKSDLIVRRLLDIAYESYLSQGAQDYNSDSRINWGLRNDHEQVRKFLDADMLNFHGNPTHAVAAFALYKRFLEEPPPSTPEWVGPMGEYLQKEVCFYLTASDAAIQNDHSAFTQMVRETLSQHTERGDLWLNQFYLDREYQRYFAVIITPLEDLYTFGNFIASTPNLRPIVSGSHISREHKENRLKGWRTPDLQPIDIAEAMTTAPTTSISETTPEIQVVLARLKATAAQEKAEQEAALRKSLEPTELQLQINAAQPGDTITLPPGRYQGPLTIEKPLTLEGAPDQTTIFADSLPAGQVSLISIKGEGPVVLRGLQFNLATGSEGAVMVTITESTARIEQCAIDGAPGFGIISRGSDLEVHATRIAQLPRIGIQIAPQNNRSRRTRITECEIRDCILRGILIRPGCDDTIVEKCRISGAGWHGIRYDNASPMIRNNVIFNNERSGIYASGRTNAQVRDNLFEGNAMSGVSCWFFCNDIIEGNTFVNHSREALAILGESAPTVHRNIFADSDAAVRWGAIGGEGEGYAMAGKGDVAANLFWNNETNLYRPVMDANRPPNTPPVLEDVSLDGESLEADPLFIDPEKGDYGLRADSPALEKGIGVTTHIPYTKPVE